MHPALYFLYFRFFAIWEAVILDRLCLPVLEIPRGQSISLRACFAQENQPAAHTPLTHLTSSYTHSRTIY